MKIKWNGHASFTITADDGTTIVTDPYDPAGYGGVLTYEMVTDRADGALISHDHLDHNYTAGLKGSPTVLKESGTVNAIEVNAVAAYHDEAQGSERGPNQIFTFTVDGVRVCFVGDLGHRLGSDHLNAIGDVDVLLVPVGGTFTVDAKGAADVTRAINPRLTIPMHYKTDKCDLPIGKVEDFLELMDNVRILNEPEVVVTPDSLPKGNTEIWVLTHAR
ncbi:MAG: MBL fold metallo-hydrolase [Desulfobacterales bacterium]